MYISTGFGLAIVKKFHEAQAEVYALDKNEEGLAALKKDLPNVITVTIDLQNWNETKKIVEALGPVHHLVNNAGIVRGATFLDISEQDVDL